MIITYFIGTKHKHIRRLIILRFTIYFLDKVPMFSYQQKLNECIQLYNLYNHNVVRISL